MSDHKFPRSRGAGSSANTSARAGSVATQLMAELHGNHYAVLPGDFYDAKMACDLKEVQDSYDLLSKDPGPGNRKRAHSHYTLIPGGELVRGTEIGFSQPRTYNEDAQGQVRKFEPLNERILNSKVVQHVIERQIALAREYLGETFAQSVTIDVHQIRYEASDLNGPSYASPAWLHRDPETFVAVVLFGLTKNVMGGDNLIAENKVIEKMFKMSHPLETLVLVDQVVHAVTPIGTTDGNIATRDILIVTVKPTVL